MDWQSIVVPIAVTAATALISWGLALLTALIKGKIGNEKVVQYLNGAIGIVDGAVKATYQTYVQALKESGSFDREAQLAALEKAKYAALAQLSEDAKAYIRELYGDVDKWLETQIESRLYELKNAPGGRLTDRGQPRAWHAAPLLFFQIRNPAVLSAAGKECADIRRLGKAAAERGGAPRRYGKAERLAVISPPLFGGDEAGDHRIARADGVHDISLKGGLKVNARCRDHQRTAAAHADDDILRAHRAQFLCVREGLVDAAHVQAECLVQLVAVGLDQPRAEREDAQQQFSGSVRHDAQIGARERGEQAFINILGKGSGHAARQHEHGPRRQAGELLHEGLERFRRDMRSAGIDLRLLLPLDLDVDARLAGDADKVRFDPARFQLSADDFADIAGDKPGRDGRHAEILQYGGYIDALAAGSEGTAVGAMQLSGTEAHHLQHVIERRIKRYRIDHDRSAFSGAAGRMPCSRRYSSKTAAAARQIRGQGRRR